MTYLRKRLVRAAAAVVGLALTGMATTAQAVTMYALETFDNILYEIDTSALGSPRLIGTIGAGSGPDLSELISVNAETLYTFDRTSNTLQTISTTDASVLSTVNLDVNVTTHPRGFDLSPDGILYGIFGSSLRTVDPATGSSTFVATLGAVSPESIAFSNDGTLYAVDGVASLYTLSRSTGQHTLIGALEGVVDIDALTFVGGFLYGADSRSGHDADLIRIDPATAGVLNLGKTGVTGLNGLAAAPAVVPLPAAFPLFGTGLGILGLLGWRRRRKAGAGQC